MAPQTVLDLYEQQGTDLKHTPKRNSLQGDGEKSAQPIPAPKASHQRTAHHRHRGGNTAGGANGAALPRTRPSPTGSRCLLLPAAFPPGAGLTAVPPRSVPPRRAPQGCTAALMPRDKPRAQRSEMERADKTRRFLPGLISACAQGSVGARCSSPRVPHQPRSHHQVWFWKHGRELTSVRPKSFSPSG